MNEGTNCQGCYAYRVSCGNYNTVKGWRRLCGACYDQWKRGEGRFA